MKLEPKVLLALGAIFTVLISCTGQEVNTESKIIVRANENKLGFRETIQENNTELENWEPPAFMKKLFPYYLSGHDLEDRPIVLFEFGKYDIRGYFESNGNDQKAVDLYEKYTDQFFYRVHNSPKQKAKREDEPTDEYALLCDMEQYDFRQLSSPLAVYQTLKLARDLNVAGDNLAYAILINTNYFGQSILNIIKPALGSVFGKIEVYGTNKDKWYPKLLKRIPKESLAEWYGGHKNYTPLAVYG